MRRIPALGLEDPVNMARRMTGLSALFDRHEHQRVWRLAGPMILTGVSTPLLGMVDTALMGHLTEARFLGAVAVGSTVISFLFWAFGFLRMGTTGITAQCYESADGQELRAVLGRALVMAAGISLVLIALQVPLGWLAYELIGAEDAVQKLSWDYYTIRMWSAPAALANYVVWGWFLGMQNARAPLYLALAINGINIALDTLFVLGLGLQAAGVAWASFSAEFIGLGLGAWLIRRELMTFPGRWRWRDMGDIEQLRRMFGINQDIFLRTLGLMFAFSFFTAQSARFGTVVLAANTLLLNFQMFMAFGLDGFAHATEALVGRAIGSGDARAFRRAVGTAGFWSLVTALVFTAAYLSAGQVIIGLLTDLDAVRAAAAEYLPWLIAAPLVSVGAFLLDGVFIGATRGAEMRNGMLISVLAVFLPAWYWLQPLGNHGLWLALLLFLAARGVTLGVMYSGIERRTGFTAKHV